MNIFRKLGFPLLFLSLAGFNLARYSDKMALSYVSMAVMLLAMGFIVGSAFVRPDGDDTDRGASAGGASGEQKPFFSPSPGVSVARSVPAWVYAAGGLSSAFGTALFLVGPEVSGAPRPLSLLLVSGGLLFILAAVLVHGGPADRRNAWRGAVALASLLTIIGSFIVLMLLAAGSFYHHGGLYGFLAGAGVLAGMGGAYYGVKYQQSAEGRAIGRELGFFDANGGGSDGIYDSKGIMNGVETLFNVEPGDVESRAVRTFGLDVLCRCPNTSGVRLSVKRTGFLGPLGISFGVLPLIPGVERWDFYDVRCDQPEVAARLLPGARRGENVFCDGAGFICMSLEKTEFKFSFRVEGSPATESVRRILQETSRLAALFS